MTLNLTYEQSRALRMALAHFLSTYKFSVSDPHLKDDARDVLDLVRFGSRDG